MPDLVHQPGGLATFSTMRHVRDLDAVQHRTDMAVALVDGINDVTSRALYRMMLNELLQKRAEELAPNGSEWYALIVATGAMESAKVISTVSRRCGR